jgi:hypothetical protein
LVSPGTSDLSDIHVIEVVDGDVQIIVSILRSGGMIIV